MPKNYQEKLVFLQKGALSMSERKEVKYLVYLLDFLESDFSTILSSSPSLLPPTSASSAMSNCLFLADLVVELVPLPTSASLAMSDGKFLANLIVVVLSIEVSGSAVLKLWMKC